MQRLLVELWICLLLAVTVGVAIGWLLRSRPRRAKETAGSAPLDPPSDPEGVAHPVEAIEGIGRNYGRRLRELGISTTLDLVREGADARGRQRIIHGLDIAELAARRWVSMADLLRVPGLGGQDAEILEAVGVATVQMFGQRDPSALARQIEAANADLQLRPDALPAVATIAGWVRTARLLRPLIVDL